MAEKEWIIHRVKIGEKGKAGCWDWEETYVYTIEEANELGIKYKYWRDHSLEKGDWCVSDDGFVMLVTSLHKRYRPDGSPYQMMVGTCRQKRYADVNMRNTLTSDKVLCRRNLNGDCYQYDGKSSITIKQRAFALCVATHFNPIKAVNDVYNIYGHFSKVVAKELMAKRKIQQEIVRVSKGILEEAGFTPEYMLEQLKNIVDNPEDKNRMTAWKEASALMDLKGQVNSANNSKNLQNETDFLENAEPNIVDINEQLLNGTNN